MGHLFTESNAEWVCAARGRRRQCLAVRAAVLRITVFLFEDSEGVVHEALQGEGGELGDALMSALFSLGQHFGPFKGGWRRMSASWRLWMISTLWEIGQSVQEPLTLRSRRSCGPTSHFGSRAILAQA